MSTTYALELKDVRKNFGKTEIIRGVNLAVQAGERVAVIGPNGAGKSTLFNLISGRFGPTSGDILLNGQPIQHKKPYEINRMGLSRSFQITNIFPKLSVFENLRCAVLWSLGYKYTFLKFLSGLKDANERAEQLMEMIRLEKKRDTLAMNLTYAEQRALEIGITIAGGADVILLDEPTAGVDVELRRDMWALVRQMRERGVTVIPLFTRIGDISFIASSMPRKLYFAPPVSAFLVLAMPIFATSRIAPSSAVCMLMGSPSNFHSTTSPRAVFLSRLIAPLRTSALTWSSAALIEDQPKCSDISARVGGLPDSAEWRLMKASTSACRAVRSFIAAP